MSEPGILTTFEPHLHMSGDRMCVEALYPNGYREILNCSGYDHNWVRTYVYEDDHAPLLPRGTILHIMGWYNNSETNSNNIEPRNWKTGGNRSVDEMFVLPAEDHAADRRAVRGGGRAPRGAAARRGHEPAERLAACVLMFSVGAHGAGPPWRRSPGWFRPSPRPRTTSS